MEQAVKRERMMVIVNPVSGTGRQKRAQRMVEQHIDRQRYDHQIVYTKAHRHAIELSHQAVDDGYDVVVIVGGDGSINEVGQGLAGTNVRMGILPAGSGNGLCRSLGIPMNLRKAVEVLNQGHHRVIDTGLANGKPFMNVAGVGFDAYVANKFHKAKLRGLLKYIILIIRSLGEYKAQTYTLYADGRRIKRTAMLICFSNSSQYGNDALVAPRAVPDDGRLDAVILRRFPFINVFLLIYRLFRGTLDESPYIKTFKFKELKVIQERNEVAHLDGDPYDLGLEIDITIRPASLKVIVPHGKA